MHNEVSPPGLVNKVISETYIIIVTAAYQVILIKGRRL